MSVQDDEPPPRFMQLKQAARYLGTSRSVIYVRAGEGRLKLVRHGGRTLVDMDSANKCFDGLPEVKPSKPKKPKGDPK
jgi:hypothetical protein